jgi:hypothetical protein
MPSRSATSFTRAAWAGVARSAGKTASENADRITASAGRSQSCRT